MYMKSVELPTFRRLDPILLADTTLHGVLSLIRGRGIRRWRFRRTSLHKHQELTHFLCLTNVPTAFVSVRHIPNETTDNVYTVAGPTILFVNRQFKVTQKFAHLDFVNDRTLTERIDVKKNSSRSLIVRLFCFVMDVMLVAITKDEMIWQIDAMNGKLEVLSEAQIQDSQTQWIALFCAITSPRSACVGSG